MIYHWCCKELEKSCASLFSKDCNMSRQMIAKSLTERSCRIEDNDRTSHSKIKTCQRKVKGHGPCPQKSQGNVCKRGKLIIIVIIIIIAGFYIALFPISPQSAYSVLVPRSLDTFSMPHFTVHNFPLPGEHSLPKAAYDTLS